MFILEQITCLLQIWQIVKSFNTIKQFLLRNQNHLQDKHEKKLTKFWIKQFFLISNIFLQLQYQISAKVLYNERWVTRINKVAI